MHVVSGITVEVPASFHTGRGNCITRQLLVKVFNAQTSQHTSIVGAFDQMNPCSVGGEKRRREVNMNLVILTRASR